MKAVILAAGQGSRLMPLTEARPKCLLEVGGQTILARQLAALRLAGVAEAVVVTGFCAEAAAAEAAAHASADFNVRDLFNPFFRVADNLASCWLARGEMDGPFLLLNGDVLFAPALLARLLAAPPAPVVLAVDRKPAYDADDMKVTIRNGRVAAVAKTLPASATDGEAIGLARFDGPGAQGFVQALEDAMRRPGGLERHYPAAIAALAAEGRVAPCRIDGLAWAEIDVPHDLKAARRAFAAAAAATARTGA